MEAEEHGALRPDQSVRREPSPQRSLMSAEDIRSCWSMPPWLGRALRICWRFATNGDSLFLHSTPRFPIFRPSPERDLNNSQSSESTREWGQGSALEVHATSSSLHQLAPGSSCRISWARVDAIDAIGAFCSRRTLVPSSSTAPEDISLKVDNQKLRNFRCLSTFESHFF